jgi:TolB-like protein
MDRPFPAYIGEKPYVFVSYSHRDSQAVYTELTWLKESGFNVWYDEGIEAGTEWREEIASAVENAKVILFFVTTASARSKNCRREVNFALDQQIPIVAVHLETTDLSGGLKMTLSEIQAILKHEIPTEEYQQKLLSRISSYLNQETTPTASAINKRPTLTMGAAIAIVFTIGVLASGLLSIDYRDEPVRRLVEKISDIAERNLIASDEIGGNITITLKDVTWREALDSVAISRGYDVRVTENAIFIGPPSQGELDLADQSSQDTRDKVNLAAMGSIAVLPFANMSTSEETGFLADGLSEDILDNLAQLKSLKVASRSASFQFTGRGVDPSDVGKRLGVSYLLEGSVRQQGETLRITAQLIRTKDGSHVWSKTYERPVADGFEMQTAVAVNIAHIAQSELGFDILANYGWNQDERFTGIDPIAVKHFINSENEYRKINLGEGGNLAARIQFLEKAIDVDSSFLRAYLALVNASVQGHAAGRLSLQTARSAAHAAINNARKLDPNNIGVQFQLAQIQLGLDLDYVKSTATFERVLQNIPQSLFTPVFLAGIDLREGRTSDALRRLVTAVDSAENLSSQRSEFLLSTSLYLCMAGDCERALEGSAEAIKLATGGQRRAEALSIHILSLLVLGRVEEARPLIDEAWRLDGSINPERYFFYFAQIGETGKARDILSNSRYDLTNHFYLALGYLALGDIDKTFTSIKAGIDNHDRFLFGSLIVAEFWDPIRDDPRFGEMLELLDSKVTHTEQYLRDHKVEQVEH